MVSFVQFELLNQVPYSAILHVKRIELEIKPELKPPACKLSRRLLSMPPCNYILPLASGTVRQWLRASNHCIFSTKINPRTTSTAG